MTNTLDVSIVLAVFNEEGSIKEELKIINQAMAKSGFSYEIIVVDDGSTDTSGAILRGLPGIRLLKHKRNKGSGAARKTGTLQARGQIVVWTDVDLSYPNERIPELIEKLRQGQCRQVVGSRSSEKGNLRFLRAPAKFLLRKLASYLAKEEIPDLNSGLRAFYRSDGLKFIFLVPDGFSCVSTMSLAFLCNGLDVDYLPIDYKKRAGRSKFHPIRDSYNYFLQIIRLITYFNPLRIFLPLSLFIFIFTLIKHIFDLVFTYDTQETDIIGYFIAVIVFTIGLLADLIVTYNRRLLFPEQFRQEE